MRESKRLRSVPWRKLRAFLHVERWACRVAGAVCVLLLLTPLAAKSQLAVQPIGAEIPMSGIEAPVLWVVPATLVAGGIILVNEFGLSEANTARFERYNGWGQQQVRFDDFLQHTPMLLGLMFDLTDVEGSRNSLVERLSVKVLGGLTVTLFVLGVKGLELEKRPDGESRDSFMSGHTATAFLGAELLRLDYGAEYPWVAAAGYGVALTTAMFRVWHARHWTGDVVAGAGIGIAAAWVGHYLGILLADWIAEHQSERRKVLVCQY